MRDYAVIERHLQSDLGTCAGSSEDRLSDDSVDTVARQALANSFYKKLCPLGVTTEQDAMALEKFKAINSRLPTTFEWTADSESESCFWDFFREALNSTLQPRVGQMVHLASDGFVSELSDPPSTEFDLDFIRQNLMIGPGSAQKADSSSIVTKLFEGVMTYTNSEHLIRLYRSAIFSTGFWADAERLRFERFGFEKVDGDKLFFAKKNKEISRTCGTSANLNMMFQKACGAFIQARLQECFGINLSTQPFKNKMLAKRGSVDGSFGTIDLVSASDSVGLAMLNSALDSCPLKDMMNMCRSECAILPDNTKLQLRMMSMMGNGFTFPLQTLIFACAVRAVYQLMPLPRSTGGSPDQFGVFGDDIVVRRETFTFLCRMLTKLGFEVNDKKSFNDGPFRESCGGDYFRGCNVRGVYITSLETSQDIVSCINRLNRWSAQMGIALRSTIHYLRWQVLDAPLVPPSESDDAGIKVPFVCTKPRVDNSYWFLYRKWKLRSPKVEVPEVDNSPNPSGSAIGYLSGAYRRADRSSTFDFGVSLLLPEGLSFDNPRIYISPRAELNSVKHYKISQSRIPWWDLTESSDWEVGSYVRWKAYVATVI